MEQPQKPPQHAPEPPRGYKKDEAASLPAGQVMVPAKFLEQAVDRLGRGCSGFARRSRCRARGSTGNVPELWPPAQ